LNSAQIFIAGTAAQIQQGVHLDRCLGGSKRRPRKQRKQQVDRRGIQSVCRVAQIGTERFVDIQPACNADQTLGEVGVDAPVARAQTDEIQVYDAQIAAPGSFNLTWHDNYTPDGRTGPDYAGGIVPNHTLNGVPGWA